MNEIEEMIDDNDERQEGAEKDDQEDEPKIKSQNDQQDKRDDSCKNNLKAKQNT